MVNEVNLASVFRVQVKGCVGVPLVFPSRHFLLTNDVPVGLMSSAFLLPSFFVLFSLQSVLNLLSTKFIQITLQVNFLPHRKPTDCQFKNNGKYLNVDCWNRKCAAALETKILRLIYIYIYIWPSKEKVHWCS